MSIISQRWFEISVGLIAIAAFAFVFWKGFERGRRAAWARFVSELSDLKKSQTELAWHLKDSNAQLKSELENAQLTPKGSVIVSFVEEGESLHKLPDGYVMRIERKLEHRSVAERILRRDLKPNEVVHHIYGPARSNNLPSNLCVLDREQHDLFHTYLEREIRIKGRYPRVADQKLSLKRNFRGILLEDPENTDGEER